LGLNCLKSLSSLVSGVPHFFLGLHPWMQCCADTLFTLRVRRDKKVGKKLCYRRRTARRAVSVEILPTASPCGCRNKSYNNKTHTHARTHAHTHTHTHPFNGPSSGTTQHYTTNRQQIEVMELKGYIRSACTKLIALDRRRCNPQTLPSTSSADHSINLP